MTSTQPHEISMNSSKIKDNPWWKEIDGIGQKRAIWLKDEFNVGNVDDFLALSINVIESRVQEANNIRWRRDEIEGSIAEALKFTTKNIIPSQQDKGLRNINVELNTISPTKTKTDEYNATFIVNVKIPMKEDLQRGPKITVRSLPTLPDGSWGDVIDEPTTVNGEQLYQWMLAQVEEKIKLRPGEKSVNVEKAAEASDATLKINQVLIFQPPQVNTPTAIGESDKPLQGYLVGNKPFDMKVNFDLVGSDAQDITKKQVPYSAQLFTREHPIGERSILGNTEPDTLIDGQISYQAKLSEVSLSPGMYRLRVLTKLQISPPISDYLEVPLLQVV